MRQPAYDSDFWGDDLDDDFDDDFEDDHFPQSGSNSLVSVPASVRQQLNNARQSIQQAQQTQQQMIQNAMQMAVTELARACPEHFAGILLQQMGGRPLALTETEMNQHIEVTDRKVLGITVGTDVKTTTHIRRHTREIRF